MMNGRTGLMPYSRFSESVFRSLTICRVRKAMSTVAAVHEDDSKDSATTANDTMKNAGDYDSQEDDEVADTAGNAGHDNAEPETAQDVDTAQTPAANTSQKAKKKKKKSKSKKSGAAAGAAGATDADAEAAKIKIARNKHMRFISSYHVRLIRYRGENANDLRMIVTRN
jgi:hypothetical protein